MASDLLFIAYEGPRDPDDSRDRRPAGDAQDSVEYIEILTSHYVLSNNQTTASLDTINSSMTPRELLTLAEEMIKKTTGLVPAFRDHLYGEEHDNALTFKYARRHATYFLVHPKGKKARLTKYESERLMEMHRQILPVYREFVQSMKKAKSNGKSTRKSKVKNGKH